MDPAHAMAEQSAGAMWHRDLRFALIEATPMRPGRGHKVSPKKGRRRETHKVIDQFELQAHAIANGLRSGSLSPEAARRGIRETGMEQFILVAETQQEFLEALATFYGDGYYMWDVEEYDGLLRVRFVTRQELT